MCFRYFRPETASRNAEPKGPVISLLDDERNELVDQMQSALPTNVEHAERRDIFEVPEDDSGPTRNRPTSEVSTRSSSLALFNPGLYFVINSNASRSLLPVNLLSEHLVRNPHSRVLRIRLVVRKHPGTLPQQKDQGLAKMTMTRVRRRGN